MQTALFDHFLGNWTPGYLLACFFLSYLYHGLGITLGYHRLLTHKSLTVPKWLMYAIVSGGYLCLQGSPIVWVGVHRLHHQKSDMAGDPHSPLEGFWHSLVGWMFHMSDTQTDEELQAQCRDLMKDPLMRRLGDSHAPEQAMLCLKINIAFRVLLFLCFGLSAVVVNILAMAIVFTSTQLVNAACHGKDTFNLFSHPHAGYRNFKTRDVSQNVWWVGILALGEGWHNNHHGIPTSARHGMKWWEVDVTWYAIWLLEKLGLGQKIMRPPAHLIPARVMVDVSADASDTVADQNKELVTR